MTALESAAISQPKTSGLDGQIGYEIGSDQGSAKVLKAKNLQVQQRVEWCLLLLVRAAEIQRQHVAQPSDVEVPANVLNGGLLDAAIQSIGLHPNVRLQVKFAICRDELSASEQKAMQTHIESCDTCRRAQQAILADAEDDPDICDLL